MFEAEIAAGPLIDFGRLESAVEAAFAGIGDQEFYPTLIQKAARLAYGISEAQAFQDGNKRLAWMTAVVFLESNGVQLDVDQTEAAHMIRAVGSRMATLEQLTEWFACCALPDVEMPQFSL
ncbi:type II toxin-antitoxin system death-on-curing family toxin [Micropruina sp.]|uniref:type II toxin-antitoxin system death-on-curing family toxin n=1 Tax=Micropruina sp. TaxID=2737536 RepID=UPI0039E4A37B